MVVVSIMWLLGLSYVVYKMRGHYKHLTTRTKKGSIDDVLEDLLKKDAHIETKLEGLISQTTHLVKESQKFYQKIGFVRFNPFERIGGEQSFVLALLDKENGGMVLNFLYTRDGIRVYAKKVEGGKSVEYELSAEEKEAIKSAY